MSHAIADATMSNIHFSELQPDADTLAQLSSLLVEVVAGGGSVSFMHPLPIADAAAFWQQSLQLAQRGARIVLGAWDGPVLAATLTLLLDCPPNQPHRAELAKMMTRPSHRGRGLARALLQRAEARAADHGRWLLVLDTASVDGAAGLYEGAGYQFAGEIPDYAYTPHGQLSGTRIYYKRLASAPVPGVAAP